MKSLNNKYKLIRLNNGDYQLDMPIVEHLPEIKLYIKNHGKYLGIYDGGTTMASIFMLFNLSSPQFAENVYEICKNNKVSKEKNVFFVETYAKDFDSRLKDIIYAINQIVLIKLDK